MQRHVSRLRSLLVSFQRSHMPTLLNCSLTDAVFLQSFEADGSKALAEDAPPVVWIHAASAGKHFLAMVILQRCLEASGLH